MANGTAFAFKQLSVDELGESSRAAVHPCVCYKDGRHCKYNYRVSLHVFDTSLER